MEPTGKSIGTPTEVQLENRLLETQLWRELVSQLELPLRKQLLIHDLIQPELWVGEGSWLDFCISVLNLAYDPRKWSVFQLLVKQCGWIYPYTEICIVCDRPIRLSFDIQHRLHAEEEPAIQFADGYNMHAYHGVSLPEKYRILPPSQWQAQWLIDEDNVELRRVLIQGIGYRRICEELLATELDLWAEYTLLKINQKVDFEPIYLLKMICPSIGRIFVLRVPPDVKSAREAICWVNWGTDPEDFSVQT